ncbi:LamG-like jellyroll fold domain-containing protein, partial [Thermodesulfobacteriota bacterium]
NLGKGIRAYFEFQIDCDSDNPGYDPDSDPNSEGCGDGFTFSLISGHEDGLGIFRNTADDTGSGGEYLGYAGPGLDVGLRPPKFGVEIDTFPNPGAGSVCDDIDSRRDDEPVANHAALVYWGEETVGSLNTGGGYIRIGSATPAIDDDEDWSSSQGTISFWFKRDNKFYGDGGFSGDRLWGQNINMETRFNSSGTFFLDWGSGGNAESAISIADPFPGTGTWYFIAITWDDVADHLYVYSGNEISISLLAQNETWTGDMSVSGLISENLFMNSSGGNGSKNYAVDGKGSDLRYYDVARSLVDLQSDYKKRLAGSEPGLQAYFPLQADLQDAGSLGISATAIGSTDWSADTVSEFDCETGAASYDDNRHGSGNTGTTTPQNSLNSNAGNGYDGYHQVTGFNPNWLEDGALHRLRMELIRPLILADDGKVDMVYDYQVKIWIDCATCSEAELAQFKDVRADFSGSLPQIEKTINRGSSLEIDPADHDDLKRVLFGFTQGTGGATQNITLRNFELYFLREFTVDPATW